MLWNTLKTYNNDKYERLEESTFLKIDNHFYPYYYKETTIIQICQEAEITVPRFCYHERLNIAGNCRMCLLELEKSPKPIASCAVSALNTMQLYTETVVVQKAREGIIEFLLINHPLDCPICDWGGECDLQDIVMVFGGDRGRFYEKKRSVLDKNCGPLIKTVMTRCIHCTRCIRFYNNIAGFPFLGTTGRGGKMEIGNYFFKSLLDSELSGNLVDLCPVGALTSKPLAFSSRPWEYQEIISVDISDSLGASIRIDFIGNKIYRIVPVINEFTNEEWIHDKARFSFDGIYLQRLTDFYIYNLVTNKSIYLDKAILINWLFFIFILVHKNLLYLNIFLGSSMDILDILYVKNIIYFSQNKQNFLNYQKKLYLPPLNFRLNNNSFLALKLSKKIIEVCLIIGLNLRVENAILNLKLRNYFLSNKTFVCSIGSHISSNFKIHELSNNLVDLFYILEGKQDFNSFLLNSKYSLLLLGFSVFFTKTGFLLWSLLNKLKIFLFSISKELEIFYISPNVTISNCLEVGLIFNNIKNKKSDKNLYILYNCDELYNIKRNKNDFFLFINHHGDSLSLKSDLIISIPTNFERNFYFINLYGIFQKTSVIFKLFNYYDFFSNHLILCKNMINNENLLLFTDSHAVEFYDLKVILISFYFYILNLGYTKIRNFFNLINDSLTTNLSLIIFSNLSYEILFPFFKTFYMTDDITKNSKIMTECIKLLINIEDNFFKMKI